MIQPHPVQIVCVLHAFWNLSFIVPNILGPLAWVCLFRFSRVTSIGGGGGTLGALHLGAAGTGGGGLFFVSGTCGCEFGLNKFDPYGTLLLAPEALVAEYVRTSSPSPIFLRFAMSLEPLCLSSGVRVGGALLAGVTHGGFGDSALAGSPHGSAGMLD